MQAGDQSASGRLAIIAGGGSPSALSGRGGSPKRREPLIISCSTKPGRNGNGYDLEHASVGNFAGIKELFRRFSITRVVLSGSVRRRPEWRQIRPTLGFLATVPFVLKTLRRGGDNAVLEMVIALSKRSDAG